MQTVGKTAKATHALLTDGGNKGQIPFSFSAKEVYLMGQRIKVYPGQKFVRLEVIRELPNKNRKRRILCRCDCGNEREFDLYKVVSGHTKSCGCYGREQIRPMEIRDLKDQVFTHLTVLRQAPERDSTGSVMWVCRCKCGREVSVSSRDLTSGNKKSCGCLLPEVTAGLQAKNEQNHTVDNVFVPILTKNISSNNVTGHKGVSVQHLKDGRIKYVANITIKGKRIYLGVYDKKEDAIDAREKAEEIYHKPYIEKYNQKKPTTERMNANEHTRQHEDIPSRSCPNVKHITCSCCRPVKAWHTPTI